MSKQNIYDNEIFFDGCKVLHNNNINYNDLLEPVCKNNILFYIEYEKAFTGDLQQYQSRIYPSENAKDLRWYHIKVNDNYIGAIWLEKNVDEDFPVLGVFITDKEYRNKGIGRAAIQKIIKSDLHNMNSNTVLLRVREENKRAVACYKSVGFKEIRKFQKNNLDVIEMAYIVEDSTVNISFSYLDKPDFNCISHDIFNILADNMSVIAPTGNTREEDYKCWFKAVSDGLKRDERHIVLIKDADSIIGFFQYYINTDTFMMEEIQLKPEYQCKNIFRKLYGFLIPNISEDMKFVEAYANITNHKSIGILKKLGLSKIGMSKNGRSFHFKGNYSDLVNWYNSK